jgi:hypothetical protein
MERVSWRANGGKCLSAGELWRLEYDINKFYKGIKNFNCTSFFNLIIIRMKVE